MVGTNSSTINGKFDEVLQNKVIDRISEYELKERDSCVELLYLIRKRIWLMPSISKFPASRMFADTTSRARQIMDLFVRI